MEKECSAYQELQNKYEKIKKFIEELIEELDDDDFIFDRTKEISFKKSGETLFKSEFLCVLTKIKCETILEELK